MADPLVSIICITYNHEPYIRQCLDGFMMQKTNFPFEVLIHDDASTDKTADIIREYEARYPDVIKPIYQTENQYSKGVKIGLTYLYPNAKGKYIAECEGDDYWTDPLKLQKQVDFLDSNSSCGLVYTNIDTLFQNSKKIDKRSLTEGVLRWNHSASYEDHLVKGGYIAPCTWMFRAKLLNLLDKNYLNTDSSFAYALDFWANSDVCFMDDVTTVYRVLEESASHTRSISKMFDYLYGILQIKCRYIKKYPHLLSDESIFRIYREGYYSILKFAVLLDRHDIIKEARPYMKYNIKSYVLSRMYNWPGIKCYIRYTLRAGGYNV